MSAALLCLAGALALWPGAGGRRRLVALGVVRARAGPALALSVLAGPVPAAAVALLTGAVLSTPLVAMLAAGCAALAARAWALRRRAARDHAQLAGLAEALGALGAELRAGRSLADAARSAAACAEPTSGEALVTAVRDPDGVPAGAMGAEVAAALGRIAAAVRLSTRTGCSLASVVAAVEDDLRARLRREQELRSATAAPRAGATLLAGLPLLGLAMGAGVGADPWGVLTTTGAGQMLLVAGVALEVAGVVWSGRLVGRALR